MAQTPQQYSDGVGIPKRLPLVTQPSNRGDSTDKDSKLVNCYPEKTVNGDWEIYKRPGLLDSVTYSESAATGRGIYNYRGDVYTVFGGTLFKNGSSIGSVSSAGFYTFSENLAPSLFLDNLTNAYEWDGAVLTQVTDGDFPNNRVPGSAYLDGTTYVGTTAARIYGSDLDDVLVWDPLNFLTARIEPDLGVAISKQLVYVLMMKGWSTEAFYDAQNASGSPLGPVQGAKVSYGCASGRSVQVIDDAVLWLTATRSGQTQVILMKNLQAEIVSTPAIERLLDKAAVSTVYSWSLKDEGHSFYVVTLVEANLTLAYDIKEQSWSQWTDVNGNYLPIVASTFLGSNTHLLQHVSNGKVYYADRAYKTDDGSVITVDLVTPNTDLDIDRGKLVNLLHVLADQEAGSVLQMRYNDHDYDPARWSQWYTLDLGQPRPFLSNLGTFRRRAHQFRHQSPTKLRMRAVDLSLDLGTL